MLHGIADILLPQTEESQKLMAKIGNLEKEVNDRRKFQIMDFTQDLHDLLHEIIGFDKSTREYYEWKSVSYVFYGIDSKMQDISLKRS